jgi:hypothetical protein
MRWKGARPLWKSAPRGLAGANHIYACAFTPT